ncbi:hypothetical protein RI367_007116 [Sorochytrium milnesiophthora]
MLAANPDKPEETFAQLHTSAAAYIELKENYCSAICRLSLGESVAVARRACSHTSNRFIAKQLDRFLNATHNVWLSQCATNSLDDKGATCGVQQVQTLLAEAHTDPTVMANYQRYLSRFRVLSGIDNDTRAGDSSHLVLPILNVSPLWPATYWATPIAQTALTHAMSQLPRSVVCSKCRRIDLTLGTEHLRSVAEADALLVSAYDHSEGERDAAELHFRYRRQQLLLNSESEVAIAKQVCGARWWTGTLDGKL